MCRIGSWEWTRLLYFWYIRILDLIISKMHTDGATLCAYHYHATNSLKNGFKTNCTLHCIHRMLQLDRFLS
uniref:Uncharacterized protein n=1 Tax=Daphnia magna TaxID=35525 RepID=A0A0P5XAJ1_9CRUS